MMANSLMKTIDSVYACLDTGDYPKAIKLCSGPDIVRLSIGQALLAYAYAGNRNISKSMEIGRRLSSVMINSGAPPEESTLNALCCTFKLCRADDEFVELMEYALKANNYNYSEHMIIDLFQGYARLGESKKMHQITQKMYKLPFAVAEKKLFYLTWSVCCMLLQDDLPSAMLAVAEKLAIKALNEVHGTAQPGSEELTMLLYILLKQKKYPEALRSLADLSSRPIPDRVDDDQQFKAKAHLGVPAFPLHKSMIKIDIMVRLGRLLDVVREGQDVILQQYPDQWNVHSLVIDCIVRMSRDDPSLASKGKSSGSEVNRAADLAGSESVAVKDVQYFEFPAQNYDVISIPSGGVSYETECTAEVTRAKSDTSAASLLSNHLKFLGAQQAQHNNMRGPFLAEMSLLLKWASEIGSNDAAAAPHMFLQSDILVRTDSILGSSNSHRVSAVVLSLVALYVQKFSDKHITYADVKPMVDKAFLLAKSCEVEVEDSSNSAPREDVSALMQWALCHKEQTAAKIFTLHEEGQQKKQRLHEESSSSSVVSAAVASCTVVDSKDDVGDGDGDDDGDDGEDNQESLVATATVGAGVSGAKKKKKKKKNNKKKRATGVSNPFAHLKTTAESMAAQEEKRKPMMLLMSAYSNYDRLASFCAHLLRRSVGVEEATSDDMLDYVSMGRSTVLQRMQFYEMYLNKPKPKKVSSNNESKAIATSAAAVTSTDTESMVDSLIHDLTAGEPTAEEKKRAQQQLEDGRVIQPGDDFLLENAAAYRVLYTLLQKEQQQVKLQDKLQGDNNATSSAACAQLVLASEWAAGLLHGIELSPGNYALKVALLEPLRLLGAAESALVTYNGLGVKQIQHDSMMYLITPLLVEMGLWSEVLKQYKQLFNMHTTARKETLEMMGRCFKHANYMKALELKAFAGRMQSSTQLALAKAEYPLLHLTQLEEDMAATAAHQGKRAQAKSVGGTDTGGTSTSKDDLLETAVSYLTKALVVDSNVAAVTSSSSTSSAVVEQSSSSSSSSGEKPLLEAQPALAEAYVSSTEMRTYMDYQLLTLTDETPSHGEALSGLRDTHLKLRLLVAQSSSRLLLSVLTNNVTEARSYLEQLQLVVSKQLNSSQWQHQEEHISCNEYFSWNQKPLVVTSFGSRNNNNNNISESFEHTLWESVYVFFTGCIECLELTSAAASAVSGGDSLSPSFSSNNNLLLNVVADMRKNCLGDTAGNGVPITVVVASVIDASSAAADSGGVTRSILSVDWIRTVGLFLRTIGTWAPLVLHKLLLVSGSSSSSKHSNKKNQKLFQGVREVSTAMQELLADLATRLAAEADEESGCTAENTEMFISQCREQVVHQQRVVLYPAAATTATTATATASSNDDGRRGVEGVLAGRVNVAQQLASSHSLSCGRLAAVAKAKSLSLAEAIAAAAS